MTDSTNDRARELAEAGAPGGTVVTAATQTSGRGRHRRVWTAPRGKALLYSAILRPLSAAHALLPLSVPIAVCDAIESVAPVSCEIKWPNDVWIHERKVAGILIEARPPDWAVIGVGVNVAIGPEEFGDDLRWPATSVGHGVDVDSMRAALDRMLGEWVDADQPLVVAAFGARDALAGRTVAWADGDSTETGTAAGVDERGNLVVVGADGESVALGAGEVQLQLPSSLPR
ncbi:MAG TPA: biotin--[acetyl-CoA-carboxylase] ligase [Solirubrobacterales bacterium]|nr:biotin--[acetyl-CoA-carboxylase] ligase [Solirubrobacterales bacterium]